MGIFGLNTPQMKTPVLDLLIDLQPRALSLCYGCPLKYHFATQDNMIPKLQYQKSIKTQFSGMEISQCLRKTKDILDYCVGFCSVCISVRY